MSGGSIIIIVLTGLSLGFPAGVVMHRSDYCIAGMFRDFFLFGNRFMLRTLLLLIISSMAIFEFLRMAGLLPLFPFPLLGSPSPANVLGGFIFGTGMVLAGGCVVGTLYKMGAGSVISAVAFAGLISGSALYAEIHPSWASFVKATTFFRGSITLPQIIGISPTPVVFLIAAVASVYFYRWHKLGKWTASSRAEGYLQPWKAALALSLLGMLSYLLIGMPMGITTSYSKMGALLEGLFFKAHAEGLVYFRAQPLDFVHPPTGLHLQGGPGPAFDGIALIQYPLILGIVLGAFFSAVGLGEFRLRFRAPLKQYLSAFAGGVIMGLASRMAPSCNVWHLLGGLPILAAQSILFLIGLLPGAWLGGRLLVRTVMKNKGEL